MKTNHHELLASTRALGVRDCSACRTARGTVLHSAAYRSTLFVDRDSEADASVARWTGHDMPDAVRNTYVEAFFAANLEGHCDEKASQLAELEVRGVLARILPGWTLKVRVTSGGGHGAPLWTAVKRGRLATSLSDHNLAILVRRVELTEELEALSSR